MKNNNDINIGKLLGESIVDVVKHRIKQENLTETVREKLDSAIKNREDIIKETTEKFSETFKKLSKDEAYDYAIEKQDFIKFENDAAADEFGKMLSKLIAEKRGLTILSGQK